MRPTILRKRADRENKSIDFIIKGPAMIRYGDTHISRVIGLNKLTFRARVLDGHILRCTRSSTGFLNDSARPNNDFAPLWQILPQNHIGLRGEFQLES